MSTLDWVLIGLYFTALGSPTALGFAGSLVVVLFSAYMLSSVFLFGAEVTKVYADHLATTGSKDSTGDTDDDRLTVN